MSIESEINEINESNENKKLFVLDTNVLIYDIESINNFGDNILVIPIVVLEELDGLKKGSALKNYSARKFVRILSNLMLNSDLPNGIDLDNGGKLFIESGREYDSELKISFPNETPDNRILSITKYIEKRILMMTDYKNHKIKETILVTKDINLRAKALSIGLNVQDYKTGRVENAINLLEDSARTIEIENRDDISKFYNGDFTVNSSDIKEFNDFDLKDNSYFILKNGSTSALTRYNELTKLFKKVDKKKLMGITPKNAEQTFLANAIYDDKIKIVACTGVAGAGKTLLALAGALEQSKDYDTIMIARPIVSLSNKDIGYLPGDVQEKINPYMQPLFDNLDFIKQNLKTKHTKLKIISNLEEHDRIVITPLAYIRGRSLTNKFFIIDEAQNLTPHEIKTIITRAGEGTKFVFTGDIQQIDSPYLDKKSNGLSYLINKMKGEHIFAHINLIKGERSEVAELAAHIL